MANQCIFKDNTGILVYNIQSTVYLFNHATENPTTINIPRRTLLEDVKEHVCQLFALKFGGYK
jgi:hypothetical protein